jgi:hypothetical protein
VVPPDLFLTTCAAAADAYTSGRALLVAGNPDDAARAFESAVIADPDFAVGHAGLAAARAETAENDDGLESAIVAAQRRPQLRRCSRGERQHVTVIALALHGPISRASALGREHLGEFPGDLVVLHVLVRRCDDVDDLARRYTNSSNGVD